MSSRPEDTPRGKSPLRCAAISPQKETPAGQRSPARLACRRPDGAEARRRPRIERATHKCQLQLPESFIRERRVKDGAIFLASGITRNCREILVLRERIELSASPLPRECSTTELPQPSTREKVG